MQALRGCLIYSKSPSVNLPLLTLNPNLFCSGGLHDPYVGTLICVMVTLRAHCLADPYGLETLSRGVSDPLKTLPSAQASLASPTLNKEKIGTFSGN